MESPLQIVFQDLEPSEEIESKIREKVAHLEQFYDRITHCRVVVRRPHRSKQTGQQWAFRIQIGVPGTELVVDREKANPAHEDMEVALRDAFEAARRKLQDYERRHLEGKVKAHEVPPRGRIARIFAEKGYGFIETPEGGDVYFHENAVSGRKLVDLEVGTAVTFQVELGDKGPQATVVELA